MLCSTLLLSGMQASIRYLGRDLHAVEIVFFRSLIGSMLLLPLLINRGLRALSTKRPGLHLLRGLIGAVSMVTWYYGLTRVPIAEATVLSFIGIVFGVLASMVFLGEPLSMRRLMAMLLSLVGMMVMLRPGFANIDIGVWAVLFSALTWGLGLVTVKVLSRTESSVTIVAWASILLTILSFFPVLKVWIWPTSLQFAWLLLIGISGTLGHLALTRALSLADASQVLPLDCTRLLWALLIGILIFSEYPDVYTMVGSLLIVVAIVYIVRQPLGSGRSELR